MSALLEDDDDDFDFEPINKAPDRLNQTLVNFGKGKRFKFCKGNSNVELGTAICYVSVENYFLTIIKHITVPNSKLEFPFFNIIFPGSVTCIFLQKKIKEIIFTLKCHLLYLFS